MEEDEEDAIYMDKMEEALCRNKHGIRASTGPAQLLDYLYLGNKIDARDRRVLRRLKITHVLNCAGNFLEASPYDDDQRITYEQFEGLDNDFYPIMRHFPQAKAFIDKAKNAGGRVFVHCELGINRSGAMCAAYMMVTECITLLQAIRRIKIERPVVLCNKGFRKQLIRFAREEGLFHSKRIQ